MRLLNATHLGLIGPIPAGLCYAGCPGGILMPCDCPAFLGI